MNPFTSAVVRSLIEKGDLERNIQHLVKTYSERVQATDRFLRIHFPDAQFSTPHGGYFFWVRIPGMDTTELRKNAKMQKVDLRPGILFSSQNKLIDYFRLSISYYDVDQIKEGILRMRKSIEK
ncbi:MAG: hypothetical protein DYH15_15045 [Nitrosomonas sp. PRO4]|nr:hypothetical protein [Nitrosomonas sp. PRO4]